MGDVASTAEDLAQDAFAELCCYPRELAAARMPSWLIYRVRNRIRNMARRRAPEPLDTWPLSLDEEWARLDEEDQ